jgi:hypothetical protein
MGQEAENGGDGSLAFERFQPIFERNIFNPNRRPQVVVSAPVERPPDPVVDEISLIGTLVTEQQTFAFFESNRMEFRGVLELGMPVADYQIAAISSKGVILSASGQSIELAVGMGLSRVDLGEWRFGTSPQRTTSPALARRPEGSSTPSPTPSAAPQANEGGSNEDLLKKLMERRRQELNQ